MATKTDRTIVEALGHPDADNVYKFSLASTTTSGILDSNTTYRFASTDDYFFYLSDTNDGPVTPSDTLGFGGIPEIFQTTSNEVILCVSGVETAVNGNLYVTKMKQPGK